MSCLAIGGCHLEGYPIGYTNSFIYNISKSFSKDVHVRANFPLSHIHKIAMLIERYNPSVVVLQLGNYEFDASLKKTLQLWRKKRKTDVEKKAANATFKSELVTVSNKANASKTNITYSSTPVLNNAFSSFFQWAWVPFVSAARTYLAADSIKRLKQITQQYPSIRFIMLTPLPLAKAADNWVRKRAAAFYKKQFSGLKNVTTLDTHSMLTNPPIFVDPSHLNQVGHAILQHVLELEIEKIKQKN